MNRLAAIATIFAMLVSGCSAKPTAEGQQTVECKGSAGLGILRVTGPQGVKGNVEFDKPIAFPVRLDIQGPPGGAVQITTQVTGIPVGSCYFAAEFSFTLPLDASGKATEERSLSYGAPQNCSVEFQVTAGTESKTEATGVYGVKADNYPAGNIDTLSTTISFATHH